MLWQYVIILKLIKYKTIILPTNNWFEMSVSNKKKVKSIYVIYMIILYIIYYILYIIYLYIHIYIIYYILHRNIFIIKDKMAKYELYSLIIASIKNCPTFLW